jgi:hypothetical protein
MDYFIVGVTAFLVSGLRLLNKVTLRFIQLVVAVAMMGVGIGLAAGLV